MKVTKMSGFTSCGGEESDGKVYSYQISCPYHMPLFLSKFNNFSSNTNNVNTAHKVKGDSAIGPSIDFMEPLMERKSQAD